MVLFEQLWRGDDRVGTASCLAIVAFELASELLSMVVCFCVPDHVCSVAVRTYGWVDIVHSRLPGVYSSAS